MRLSSCIISAAVLFAGASLSVGGVTEKVLDVEMVGRHIHTYLAAERFMQHKLKYENGDDLSKRLGLAISNTKYTARKFSEPSLLNEEGFRAEMADLVGRPFGFNWEKGNQIELLVNGKASFKVRKELIEQARESIHIFVWAIYDDETGYTFAKWLHDAKLKRMFEGADLDIKIIVDGGVAKDAGMHSVLDEMAGYKEFSRNPIKIVRVNDRNDPYFGMHRKVIIVDRKHLVMGGINVGNKFSHLAPDKHGWWRDNDVAVTGPIVDQAQKVFVDEWNEQRGKHELDFIPQSAPVPTVEGSGSLIVDHQPLRDDNILLLIMKACYGATHTIDIENAFFILDEASETALSDALARGVRVRILSNSKESLKQGVVTVPAIKAMQRLKERGAEIYTKKVADGTTAIHSKFMIVDGVFAWMGSHNFHPRSERYEREIVLASFDKAFVTSLNKTFDHDLLPENAAHPTTDELKAVKESGTERFIYEHFFDQM